MKRLTTIEKGGLVLGLMFIVVGACMIVHPIEGIFYHPDHGKRPISLGPNPPEHLTKRGSRIYGEMSVVFGIGFTCFCILPWRAVRR